MACLYPPIQTFLPLCDTADQSTVSANRVITHKSHEGIQNVQKLIQNSYGAWGDS